MHDSERLSQEANFIRMSQVKTRRRKPDETLSPSVVQFYKTTIQRTRKFAGIAEVWETLVPPDLNEHCCLESFRAGSLMVLVDSSPHLYRLKQLLLAGLQKQMLELCRAKGLRKINLKPGRWYEQRDDDLRPSF